MGKKLPPIVTSEQVIEAKERSLLDHESFLILLTEPYLLLMDAKIDRLNHAVNILAVEKEYRVVNIAGGHGVWTVCLEKK